MHHLSKITIVILLLFISTTVYGQSWSTCNRMHDGEFGAYAARLACISSCKVQNCSTGYCQFRSGRKTCVCSRCDVGGGWFPGR